MRNKPLLLIDLRSIQDFQNTGVHIAGKNWIEGLIQHAKNDEQILLWSNSNKRKIKLPRNWTKKKNIRHIQTNIPNFLLNILWSRTNFFKLEKLLNISTKYIYFSPDIRPYPKSKNQLRSFTYIHDLAFLKRTKDFSLKSRIWFKLINPIKIVNQSTTILTNSKFSEKQIQKQFQTSKTRIIHPSLPKKLKTKKTNLPTNDYYLCISSIQKRKNIQMLTNLFKDKKSNLVIIGKNLKIFSKTKVQKTNNIYLLENIPNQKKHFLIKNCKAMIYPSLYEGFGLPILEGSRFNKITYTYTKQPFIDLFPNEIKPISKLFKEKNKKYKFKKKYQTKIESKKLKKLLYRID